MGLRLAGLETQTSIVRTPLFGLGCTARMLAESEAPVPHVEVASILHLMNHINFHHPAFDSLNLL